MSNMAPDTIGILNLLVEPEVVMGLLGPHAKYQIFSGLYLSAASLALLIISKWRAAMCIAGIFFGYVMMQKGLEHHWLLHRDFLATVVFVCTMQTCIIVRHGFRKVGYKIPKFNPAFLFVFCLFMYAALGGYLNWLLELVA